MWRGTRSTRPTPLPLIAALIAVLAVALVVSPAPLAAQAEQEESESAFCEDRARAAQKRIAAAMRQVARDVAELRALLMAPPERAAVGRAEPELSPRRGVPVGRLDPGSSWAETCCKTELERTLRAVATLEKETAELRRTCDALPSPRAATGPCKVFPTAVEELGRQMAALHLAASLADAREKLQSAVRTTLSLATQAPEESGAREYFARAEFQELEDSERLGRPGFEALSSGCRLRPAIPAYRDES